MMAYFRSLDIFNFALGAFRRELAARR